MTCSKFPLFQMDIQTTMAAAAAASPTSVDHNFGSSFVLNRFERDAVAAREALQSNNGVDYNALIEIFTCRKSSHVLQILQAYLWKYKCPLEFLHRTFPSLPKALSASHKAHHDETSQYIAKCDAKRLYETGEGKSGRIDQSVVLEMLSKRSIAQLKITFFSYKHVYGHSYTSFQKNHNFGDFEDALRIAVKCICSPPKYYAKTLHDCLAGTRDECALVRIMVSRAEIDMDEICTIFKKKYGIELKDAIFKNIPDGNHREFLVGLASNDSSCKRFTFRTMV